MKLDDLTPDSYQKRIIDDFTAERTIVVTGVAGSGKSLTLLKKAKQVSTYSDSYAIIVYTKSLKQFFRDELSEIDPKGEHVYYLDEWRRSKQHYKYLFIDECQDFNADEIADFAEHGEYLWLFGDNNQSIMAFKATINNPESYHTVQSVEDTIKQLNAEHQDLCLNHRLTIENAAVGEHIFPDTNLRDACLKHGPKPLLLTTDARAKELDEIIRIIRDNSLTNVGILNHYNRNINFIREHFASKGIAVEWKTNSTEGNIDFNSTNPKVMTIHCAKGLQFSYVFIPFCHEPTTFDYEKATLYVASTRPLTQLILTSTGSPSKFLPPEGFRHLRIGINPAVPISLTLAENHEILHSDLKSQSRQYTPVRKHLPAFVLPATCFRLSFIGNPDRVPGKQCHHTLRPSGRIPHSRHRSL